MVSGVQMAIIIYNGQCTYDHALNDVFFLFRQNCGPLGSGDRDELSDQTSELWFPMPGPKTHGARNTSGPLNCE